MRPLFVISTVTVFLVVIPHVLSAATKRCSSDEDCEGEGEFCLSSSVFQVQVCHKCIDCPLKNRFSVGCARKKTECGPCLPGYMEQHDRCIPIPTTQTSYTDIYSEMMDKVLSRAIDSSAGPWNSVITAGALTVFALLIFIIIWLLVCSRRTQEGVAQQRLMERDSDSTRSFELSPTPDYDDTKPDLLKMDNNYSLRRSSDSYGKLKAPSYVFFPNGNNFNDYKTGKAGISGMNDAEVWMMADGSRDGHFGGGGGGEDRRGRENADRRLIPPGRNQQPPFNAEANMGQHAPPQQNPVLPHPLGPAPSGIPRPGIRNNVLRPRDIEENIIFVAVEQEPGAGEPLLDFLESNTRQVPNLYETEELGRGRDRNVDRRVPATINQDRAQELRLSDIVRQNSYGSQLASDPYLEETFPSLDKFNF